MSALRRRGSLLVLTAALLLGGCASDGAGDGPADGEVPLGEGSELGDEAEGLPLGALAPADGKADGVWGAATECKAIPALPRLAAPKITISIDGLTLRLEDTEGDYEQVFPIGAGSHDTDETSTTFGESLSYFPLLSTGRSTFEIRPARSTPCAIWWTNRATGERLPVFAGLPFMSWYGSYGIHGPIDDYRAPQGGNLRRGYVSHGCIRMEAADVLEVYGRIRGVASVPVVVQREAERRDDGTRLDVEPRWIGAECTSDGDCSYDGGVCRPNPWSGRSFCTKVCERYCPDRAGYPGTFCVDDPDDADHGFCVPREAGVNLKCRPYDHFVPQQRTRHGQPSVRVVACVPGSPGWVGDACLEDSECHDGGYCQMNEQAAVGRCTLACDRFCPDLPGWPWTFCVREPALGTTEPRCLRRCTPERGAPECPAGTTCEPRERAGSPAATRSVCVPSTL